MEIRPRSALARLVAASLLVVLMSSCGSKINEKNYERIKDGMTKEEVESILGPPTEMKSIGFGGFSGSHGMWKAADGTTITIQFVNGKVASKQLVKSDQHGN